MQWILQNSTQRIEILRPHELDSDDIPVEFRDIYSALDFLRNFTLDPFSMIALRSVLAGVAPIMNIYRLTDDELLQQLAWQIAYKHLFLVKRAEELPHVSGLGVLSDAETEDDSSADSADTADATTELAEQSTTDTEESTDSPAVNEEITDWIEFRIVDDETDMPMPDVGLKIRLPDGEIKDYTTDSNGIVRIDNLSPGTCDIVEMTDPDAAEVIAVE